MKKAGLRAWLAFAMIAVFSMASADVLTMPKSEEAAPAPAPAPAETTPGGDQAAPAAEMPAPEPSTATAPAPAPVEHTPVDSSSKTVPGRGMTMHQVESRFGSPKEKIPAVGDPPITRWDYGWYTVYFEKNYVIDSVIHH